MNSHGKSTGPSAVCSIGMDCLHAQHGLERQRYPPGDLILPAHEPEADVDKIGEGEALKVSGSQN